MDTQQFVIQTESIFDNVFIDGKCYFMYCYRQAPCIITIGQVDTEKALDHIKQKYADVIAAVYQYADYHMRRRRAEVEASIVVLHDQRIMEIGRYHCDILYLQKDAEWAQQIMAEIACFKIKEKRPAFEINLIAKGRYGLDLKSMEIKRTKLQLDLYYEDAFLETDRIIQSRLKKRDDKGIVLLHGLPGTGKTTYLRYLIGRLKKKALFLPPSAAENILAPDFMDLLIDNPNSVLIIEDAENVIMDRRVSGLSSVSNILNISDGLLADFLNVQLICTFNHPVSMVDQALLRKGRLIAQYEFGKLGIKKAQRLSDHLGYQTTIDRPMTIAEITNQHDREPVTSRQEVIGFARASQRMAAMET